MTDRLHFFLTVRKGFNMGYDYKRFTEGMLGANTYILWDTDTKEALIIDTGNPVESPLDFV